MISFIGAFILLLSALFSVGCARSTVKSLEKNPVAKGMESQRPASIQVFPGRYNIDELIKKTFPKGWEKDYWFEIIDNKNGYAKMGFFGQGAHEFYLFTGNKKNVLVKVMWGCGRACEQVVKVYEFSKNNTSFKKIKLSGLMTKYARTRMARSINKCEMPESFNSFSNSDCGTILDFSRFTKMSEAYRAKFKSGEKVEGVLIGRLMWKMDQFHWLGIK